MGRCSTHSRLQACAAHIRTQRRQQKVKPQQAELTDTQLTAHLVRLGGQYERARLAVPPDYEAAQDAEFVFERFQTEFPSTNCGIWFRRGQNVIRRLRGLDEVVAW